MRRIDVVGGRLLLERAWSVMTPAPRAGGPGRVAGAMAVDVGQAIWALRAHPMGTLSVAATIALAVGATTSVFTVVEGVLLRPLPYPESDRLVRLWQSGARWSELSDPEFRSDENRLTPLGPTYYDWLSADLGLQALGAYADAAFVLQQPGSATALRGQEATSGLFDALDVAPLLGRRLEAGDDLEGAPPVVVLAKSFWWGYFASDQERWAPIPSSTARRENGPPPGPGVPA